MIILCAIKNMLEIINILCIRKLAKANGIGKLNSVILFTISFCDREPQLTFSLPPAFKTSETCHLFVLPLLIVYFTF